MSDLKAPGWSRAAQIGLGALAIILSILIIAFPGIGIVSIVLIIGVLLLIVGIESVITGIFVKSKSRMANIGLGIIVIILAIIVMAFPVGTTIFLIILMGVALLIDGISRLIHGFGDRDRENRGWSRGFRIGVGALEIAFGILILVSPAVGVAFVAFVIAIALLIVGIQMIVAGIYGRRTRMLPSYGR